MNTIYDKFCEDIERYLASKLPDLPKDTAMEIGEYISARTNRLVTVAYADYEETMDKRYKRHLERYARPKPGGDS